MKLLSFMTEECKVSKGMTKPEQHCQTLGRLMCVSSIVESQLYQLSQSQVNHDALNKVTNDLIQMFQTHDYVRESIQSVLAKLLRTV